VERRITVSWKEENRRGGQEPKRGKLRENFQHCVETGGKGGGFDNDAVAGW